MIGHSAGEYVAACLAGVFSLEEALRIVVYRSNLLALVKGSMLSVSRSPHKLLNYLDSRYSICS